MSRQVVFARGPWFTLWPDQKLAIKASIVHASSYRQVGTTRMKPPGFLFCLFFLLFSAALAQVSHLSPPNPASIFSIMKIYSPPGVVQQGEGQSWPSHLPLLLLLGFCGMYRKYILHCGWDFWCVLCVYLLQFICKQTVCMWSRLSQNYSVRIQCW